MQRDKPLFRRENTADAQAEFVADLDDFSFGDFLVANFDRQRAVAAFIELNHQARSKLEYVLDGHALAGQSHYDRDFDAQQALAKCF